MAWEAMRAIAIFSERSGCADDGVGDAKLQGGEGQVLEAGDVGEKKALEGSMDARAFEDLGLDIGLGEKTRVEGNDAVVHHVDLDWSESLIVSMSIS